MRVSVDDVTIDVAIEGRGEPIVLLAGFPLTRRAWGSQSSALASRARVIRPDLRGIGASSVAGGPYLMETLAGDVAAVLDALSIDRTAIAGHSLGGYVALAFARMFTERLTRLALVCSRLQGDSEGTARGRHQLADRIESERDIEPAIEAYVPRLFAQRTLENDPGAVESARAMAREIDPFGAAAMLRGMAQRLDSSDIAGDLDVPVLIVAGECDRIVSREEAQAMRDAFPRAELRFIRKCGHLPMLEAPHELTEILLKFLES